MGETYIGMCDSAGTGLKGSHSSDGYVGNISIIACYHWLIFVERSS